MCYVILVRGINVGGVTLKMEVFRDILSGVGLTGIRTYIQSGNAVADGPKQNVSNLADAIASAIKKKTGIDAPVLVRDEKAFGKIAAAHPFVKKGGGDKLFVTLLNGIPASDAAKAVTGMKDTAERFIIRGDVVYAYYGNGYGRSKFTNNYLEKKLGVAGTTRNWNTMQKLFEMLASDAPEQ